MDIYEVLGLIVRPGTFNLKKIRALIAADFTHSTHKDRDSFRHLAYFFPKQTKLSLYSQINNYIYLINQDLHKFRQKHHELCHYGSLNHLNDYSAVYCYYVYARNVSALIDIIHTITGLTMPVIISFHCRSFHDSHWGRDGGAFRNHVLYANLRKSRELFPVIDSDLEFSESILSFLL
ncbi:Hypothetical predicted protein [Octopus vulgaris]|uniref:Uncharacterized protein n=1 Tax=Octopus vulgaris TaxID=6645 RepID=A0AA36B7F5_OCTVU|nr:Hypothetical predicted protein [Octopus vulgaris]